RECAGSVGASFVVTVEEGERLSRPCGGMEGVARTWLPRFERRQIDTDPRRAEMDRGQEIQAQLDEVGELLAIDGIGEEMGGDQPNPAQTSCRAADAFELRQVEAVCVSQDHALDPTATVDEQTDPAIELAGEVEHLAREGGGDDSVGGDAAFAEALQQFDVARLERGGITEDYGHGGVCPSSTRKATASACWAR